MINFSKNKLVEEAQWARTDLVLKHCPGDTPVLHEANLRLYKAIEALEQEVKDLHVVVSGDKVPDAAKDTHPYFKLYRLEYHRHLATKKQMSNANGEMQRKLKKLEHAAHSHSCLYLDCSTCNSEKYIAALESKYTEAVEALAFERIRVGDLRRILGERLDEVRP